VYPIRFYQVLFGRRRRSLRVIVLVVAQVTENLLASTLVIQRNWLFDISGFNGTREPDESPKTVPTLYLQTL